MPLQALKIFIYLGCIGSYLQHAGSFVEAFRLSSYGAQAQKLWLWGLIALCHVGS